MNCYCLKGLIINSNYLDVIRERTRRNIEFEREAWKLIVMSALVVVHAFKSRAAEGGVLVSGERSRRNLCLGCGWRAASRRRHTR